MTLMQRRRALMAGDNDMPWERIDYPLTSFNSPTGSAGYSVNDNIIRIWTKTGSPNPYQAVNGAFRTSNGYEYKVTCRVTVNLGVGRIATRNLGNAIRGLDTGTIRGTDVPINLTFNHNPEISSIGLFCNFSTRENGDVTYTDFALYRRPL